MSLTSWGTVCQGRPAHGAWTATQCGWHINRLELLAVFIALQYFLNLLIGRHVLLRSDNMAVVSYLNQQGGLRSHPLCRLARIILLGLRTDSVDPNGSCPRALELRNGFVLQTEPGARGMEVAPPNGSLIWQVFGEVKVDLFMSSTTTYCPLWFSLCPPSPLGMDALAHDWPRTSLCFSSNSTNSSSAIQNLAGQCGAMQPWFADLVNL